MTYHTTKCFDCANITRDWGFVTREYILRTPSSVLAAVWRGSDQEKPSLDDGRHGYEELLKQTMLVRAMNSAVSLLIPRSNAD
jgi:hypothetical protein